MNSRMTIALAAVAAAVALSGCTTVVGGESRPGAALRAAETATATTPAPPVQESQWVDVTGQGDIDMADLPQHGLKPAPGIAVGYRDGEGPKICTIGPGTSGGGFLTAGHCSDGGVMTRAYLNAVAHGGAPQPSGWIVRSEVREGNPYMDAAIFENEVAGSSRIAETWPVAGVMTVAGVKQLPVNTMVCLDGAVTGVRCGRGLNLDENGIMRIAVSTKKGDSGAAVFVVDREGRAALVGLVKGGDRATETTTTATFLEPALQSLGVKALLDRDITPFAGAEFNAAVTAQK